MKKKNISTQNGTTYNYNAVIRKLNKRINKLNKQIEDFKEGFEETESENQKLLKERNNYKFGVYFFCVTTIILILYLWLFP